MNNPMSVAQTFLLATRNGALALRRDDLGVLSVGAKADLVVWDGESPALLGWNDPVAAVILHASVADVEHVLVDGKWKKRDFELVVQGDGGEAGYPAIKERFLASTARIQRELVGRILNEPVVPAPGGIWEPGQLPYEHALTVDTYRGNGTGYGELFLEQP